MNEVDRLIESFDAIKPKGADSGEKIRLLNEVEGSSGPAATSFFVRVATDAEENDLARIEALRILRLQKLTAEADAGLVAAIGKILEFDEDDVVRAHAALVLSNPALGPGAAALAARTLLDPDEDLDVRHNALLTIERGERERAKDVLTQLLDDDYFAATAERLLTEWSR